MSMQGLMLLGIIILGLGLVRMHKENKANYKEWQNKIEAKEAAMSLERKERISMLIEVLREDTRTKAELKGAIDNNTRTIERFETLLTKLIGTKIAI